MVAILHREVTTQGCCSVARCDNRMITVRTEQSQWWPRVYESAPEAELWQLCAVQV